MLNLRTLKKSAIFHLWRIKGGLMKELILSLGKDGLKSAYTLLSDFALYLTLAVAVILAVTYIVVKLKTDKISYFKTLAFGIIIGYAVTLTACISFLMVARLYVKEEIDVNFYLMLGFFALLLVYSIAVTICSTLNKKAFKICNYVGLSVAVAYSLVLLFVLPTVEETYAPLSVSGMYVFSAIFVAVICLLTIFFGKDDEPNQNSTKAISFAGVCIALSFALSYVKLFSMPQGGSVTLASMLPLIIYSYVFGARKGVFAGVIYGVLQCLQSPQIYQPLQVLLDYPIAFACIGLAGIAKNINFLKTPLLKFVFGASIACVGRYLAHFLSGYYVFSSWAMEGYTALSWAIVYNLYIIVELAIILFVGWFLFASKSFVKQLNSIKE